MKLQINTVDAFADVPFKGNPAAVCILTERIHDSLMQNIAMELNLSETAFVYREDNGSFHLLWFTPMAEVDLCGHATLASTHILFEKGIVKPDEVIVFNTKSGELITKKKSNGEIIMDFPVIKHKPTKYPPELLTALGIKKEPPYVGMTKWNYVVEMESDEEVRNCDPDYGLLKSLPGWGTIITARSATPEYDFVSRFFAPEKGVVEDPVTGSAHCALAPYWAEVLGKNEFRAYQASARGGILGVKLEGDRVFLTGKALTIMSGEMVV
jgi:PhzF family phenazine biosynthesis protein